jgi:2'-hydroxyisoflavone reductase
MPAVRLLVLGGTQFLGRAIGEAARARGHELTLFTRGRTNPHLFPDAERLRGDRDGDLSVLGDGCWDAVVDTSGYVPRVVRASAELLVGAVEHYTFVSSVSVYRPPFTPGFTEEAPLERLADPATENVQEAYGALKAACERVVEEVFPGAALNVRAGLVVGPHDPTDRFTYWPRRVAAGGEVLAPGRPDRPWQFVDVRDLGEWIVRMAEERGTGTFTVTGPAERTTAADVLSACRDVSGADATFTWVDERFLLERNVGPWMELPLWIPEGDPHEHMQEADVSRALAAGLAFRPVAETIRDTLAWDRARGTPRSDVAGMRPERERELLAEWHRGG